MAYNPNRRGPLPTYQTKEEKYEARKARQREKYQREQAAKRHSTFNNAFQSGSTPVANLQNLVQLEQFAPTNPYQFQPLVHYDNAFLPVQFDDDFGQLLSLSPPRSPSLGSASIDISEISEPEVEELNILAPAIKEEDVGFQDINELVPDPEAGDQSALKKLSIRLADQLI